MDNYVSTPLKVEQEGHKLSDSGCKNLSYSTPGPSAGTIERPEDAAAAVDSLSGSFTGMKLNAHRAAGGGAQKRSVDRITVEGSPMVPQPFKQANLNHTPQAFAGSSHGGESDEEDAFAHDEPDAYSSAYVNRLSPILESVAPTIAPPPSPPHVTPISSAIKAEPASVKVEPVPAPTSSRDKVLVICSASSEHNTGDHQENMLRTALLCGDDGCLRRPELANSIDWINSDTIQPAALCDLLRVHEYSYLQHLANKSRHASDHAQGKTPSPSAAEPFPAFYAPQGMLDTDTPLLPQSLEAAKRFCGAAMLAVDYAMDDILRGAASSDKRGSSSSSDRVFVIGRPPGHHAGPNGCVISDHHWRRPDMTSSGFCLLNTVAVAAAYARYQYGRLALRSEAMARSAPSSGAAPAAAPPAQPRPPRIAIVDIDIHHGNGTEDIVRNLRPRQVFLPLPSSWAPMTALNFKPWLDESDADDVLFSSIHLFAGERFYPCSGAEVEQAARTEVDKHIINICLTPVGPGPWDYKARHKLTDKHREELCATASREFRDKVSRMLLPQLGAFQPDLLFISAGFDAHYDDSYHFLTEADVHWVTERMCQAVGADAGRCKVISVLEGGYSLSSTIPAAPKPTKTSASKTAAAAAAAATAATAATAEPSAAGPEVVGSGDKSRPVRSQAKKVYSAKGVSAAHSEEARSATAVAGAGVTPTPAAVEPVTDPHFVFAQRLGDGGLVKGVLAHVAALAGKKTWK